MHARQLFALAGSAVALAAVSLVGGTSAAGAPAPWMYHKESPRFLTYSAWGRRNNVTNATCTGRGRAGKRRKGPTYSSFRCRVRVREVPAGVVVAKVLGPESLRVVRISGGKLKPDRGIGPVPRGRPVMTSQDASLATYYSSWATTNRLDVACHGVGLYRELGLSLYFFAFDCATFDRRTRRGPQVLVTASGKSSVRVVRVLAP